MLTARKAPVPLGVRADRLIIATHVVAVRRCSLAGSLQVPAALDDVMFLSGGGVLWMRKFVINWNVTGKGVKPCFNW